MKGDSIRTTGGRAVEPSKLATAIELANFGLKAGQAAAFLQQAHEGRRVFLNAISRRAGPRKPIEGCNVDCSNAKALEEWIAGFNGNEHCSYWMPNQPKKAVLRAKQDDIEYIRWAFLDVDPVDGESQHSVLERVRAWLKTFPLQPTFVICSGNGVQLFWRLRAVGDVGLAADLRVWQDPERIELARAVNKGLIKSFGGKAAGADGCYSLDHLYRIPWTINWKRKDGRPPLACFVIDDLSHPGASYGLNEFPLAHVDAAKGQAKPVAEPVNLPKPFGAHDLRTWAAENGKSIGELLLARIADGDASCFHSRSELVFYVCAELLRCNVPKHMIASAIYNKANGISAHIWDRGGQDPWRYACRQVDNAESSNWEQGDRPVDAARRANQLDQNRFIGQGEFSVPPAELINLETALGRFVFCSDGSRVVDLSNPHFDLQLHDWVNTYAASKIVVDRPKDSAGTGSSKKLNLVEVPISKLWINHGKRRTVVTRTFKAGGPVMLLDPEGRYAVNSWRAIDRGQPVGDTVAAGLDRFLDHVEFLFAADAPRFLDWLAHIEQEPGVLPHTAWLHVARKFGMGRNWLGSVLARVWAGSVAANFDLVATLKSGFNGGLSRKLLAIVDEIREGGRDSQWDHAEKLKKIVTEETRTVNPKYGRQSIEFNSCRWLMFSNHLSAIPMEAGDRRFEVVQSEAEPRCAAYYTDLYGLLEQRKFILAVAQYLAARDISLFNPGAHARLTEAKRDSIEASQSPDAYWAELIASHWPCDVAPNPVLWRVLSADPEEGDRVSASQKRALESVGVLPLGKPIRLNIGITRLAVIRNRERWKAASGDEVRAEWERGEAIARRAGSFAGVHVWREYLQSCVAQQQEPDQFDSDLREVPF